MASDGDRIFGDRETALILQKAAELQAQRGGRSSGLTLEELRQIASEAGIEPHFVDEAWAELRGPKAPPAPPKRKTRRGQTRWEQRLALPVRLDNEDVRALLAHLEAEFGGHGTITELSCGTVWTQYRLRHGHTHAAVEKTETGTRLHIALERSTQRKFMRRVGGVIGGVIGAFFGALTDEPAGLMLLTGLGITFGNLSGRGTWRLIALRWSERLDRLISTLSGEALRNGTPLSAPPAPPAPRSGGPEAAVPGGQAAVRQADRP
ncbi:MAG TPA: hypothetical protein VF188_02565 [Longimicrobiales bacterium]